MPQVLSTMKRMKQFLLFERLNHFRRPFICGRKCFVSWKYSSSIGDKTDGTIPLVWAIIPYVHWYWSIYLSWYWKFNKILLLFDFIGRPAETIIQRHQWPDLKWAGAFLNYILHFIIVQSWVSMQQIITFQSTSGIFLSLFRHLNGFFLYLLNAGITLKSYPCI